MQSYGLTLLGADSNVSRAPGDPSTSGPTFPSGPTNGQLWQLTAVVGQNQIGTYVYSTVRASWVKQTVDYQPYDVGLSLLKRYAASAEVARYLAVRSTVVHKNFAGSAGVCDIAPTANTTFSVRTIDGASGASTTIGTVNFIAGQKTAVFTPTVADQDIVLISGDLLKIFAPATVDTTIANIAITIAGRMIG